MRRWCLAILISLFANLALYCALGWFLRASGVAAVLEARPPVASVP